MGTSERITVSVMGLERRRLFDLVFALTDRLGRSPRLSLSELLDTARRKTGLDDYGDRSFLEPLEILLSEFRESSQLTPLGRRLVQATILEKLGNRLSIERFRHAHPELETKAVRRPLLVTGHARSGTTLLHRLLALDPCGRAPAYWETRYPVPPASGADRRRHLAQRSLAQYYKWNPSVRAVHHLDVDDPEECIGFFDNTFVSVNYFHYAPLPAYTDWLVNRPEDHVRRAYAEYCFQLKALNPDENRHWVLKAPAHLPYLDVVEWVFEAPTIIVLHRDPRRVLPSTCSLLAHTRSLYQERVDKAAAGEQVASSWSRRTRRLFDTKCHREGRAIHVAYEDLIDDPVACVEQIYAEARRSLTSIHLDGMKNYLRENPMHKHGVHLYSLQEYGLDERVLRREWRAYDEFCASLRKP